MKIRISGSLGCLMLAAERNICTLEQANIYLNEMVNQGYRSLCMIWQSCLKQLPNHYPECENIEFDGSADMESEAG